jgi:DNA-binding NarL/FixJ family response regulator
MDDLVLPVLVSFLQTALERGGIKAVGAISGQQALDLLKNRKFAGIVSDLKMPGPIGGAEIYDWVCENIPELKPCFLFITGNVMDEYAVSVRERTGALFIQKPFRISLLIELIRKAAAGGEISGVIHD